MNKHTEDSSNQEEDLRNGPEESGLESHLVTEADVPAKSDDSFERQLEATLQETEQAVMSLKELSLDPDQARSWSAARSVIEEFKPVPWFIWRLSNFVLGRPGSIGDVSEGLVFGLRRLMFALGSDETVGVGEKVNSVRKALSVVESDVIASASVIHAVCRRLASKEHERIWKPILDDALLRARIGHDVGARCPGFGSGRGMLSGFAGRAGLAILISLGDLNKARRSLELLATGRTIKETGFLVYECDPLQVSAMMLTAAGIGRDAAFGTVNFSVGGQFESLETDEQRRWLAAFEIIENMRMVGGTNVTDEAWAQMNFDEEAQVELRATVKTLVRRGHGWQWMM
ncbi:MAG: hypothetical protein KDD60_10295 [Bdellovibrionales bacterium]|nr:hypothetical protein [Bdellovibrionales bacterium]